MIAEITKADEFISMGGNIDEYRIVSGDDSKNFDIDVQYLFMNDWAFRRLYSVKPALHYDVGSQVQFLFYMSNFVQINFIDIRNPGLSNKRFSYHKGDITDLPFKDGAIKSLSCLHVAEHIGLGRYGDKIDPNGFVKACFELSRVLAEDGMLYFAVPIGRPKVVFNAHRVLSSKQILEAFKDLRLVEFSGITTSGSIYENVSVGMMDNEDYGVGMFRFTK